MWGRPEEGKLKWNANKVGPIPRHSNIFFAFLATPKSQSVLCSFFVLLSLATTDSTQEMQRWSRETSLPSSNHINMDTDQHLPTYDPLSHVAQRDHSRLRSAHKAVHLIPLLVLLCAIILWLFSSPLNQPTKPWQRFCFSFFQHNQSFAILDFPWFVNWFDLLHIAEFDGWSFSDSDYA